MYAHLTAEYTAIAQRHGALDEMKEALFYKHSMTDSYNSLLSIADPETLDTPEKRQRVYDEHINTLTPLHRCGAPGYRLHPNLMLAKVEHWIRCLERGTVRYPMLMR